MLKKITMEDFTELLNTTFQLQINSETVNAELIEVSKLGEGNKEEEMRQPFSVLFRGPIEPVLPQQIYKLNNESMGEIELFLVPVGKDELGILYEAVFA